MFNPKRKICPHGHDVSKYLCGECDSIRMKARQRKADKAAFRERLKRAAGKGWESRKSKYNPRGRRFGDLPIGTKFQFLEPLRGDWDRPIVDTRSYYKLSNYGAGLRLGYPASVAMSKSTIVGVEAYPPPRARENGRSGIRKIGNLEEIRYERTGGKYDGELYRHSSPGNLEVFTVPAGTPMKFKKKVVVIKG